MSWQFTSATSDWAGNTSAAPLSDITSGATIACWFNSNTIGGANLINICNSTGNDNLRLATITTSLAVRANSVVSSTGSQADSTTGTSVGTWTHACATFASGSRSAFLNGGSKATTTGTSSPSGFTRLHIGSRRASSVTDSFFGGQIAEIGVWNAVLTDDEILSLARGITCLQIRESNLVFYAPLIRNLADYSSTNLSLSAFGSAGVDSSGRHPRIYL